VYIGIQRSWKILILVIIVMTTVMYFMIAIVWIVTFISYTEGKFCANFMLCTVDTRISLPLNSCTIHPLLLYLWSPNESMFIHAMCIL